MGLKFLHIAKSDLVYVSLFQGGDQIFKGK